MLEADRVIRDAQPAEEFVTFEAGDEVEFDRCRGCGERHGMAVLNEGERGNFEYLFDGGDFDGGDDSCVPSNPPKPDKCLLSGLRSGFRHGGRTSASRTRAWRGYADIEWPGHFVGQEQG